MIPRRVWTFTFYYITTIHWRAPFSLCFDLRASSKISRNSMMPRFASWVSICLVIVLMIVFSHFHGHLLYMYHCVSDLEEFHWMVFSADQRFGKFLLKQDLASSFDRVGFGMRLYKETQTSWLAIRAHECAKIPFDSIWVRLFHQDSSGGEVLAPDNERQSGLVKPRLTSILIEGSDYDGNSSCVIVIGIYISLEMWLHRWSIAAKNTRCTTSIVG